MPAAAAETGGERTEVEPSSRWARVDGLWMHYRTAGEVAIATRPAVVLVHGLVVSSRYMVPTLKRLARDYRVYAPDLPGFGESEKLPDSLDVPGLSSALSAWMDVVGLKQAALVGNSMGCQVIVHLAARRPELVEQVVLQAPTMDPCGRSVPRQVARFLLDVPREPLSLVPIELCDLLAAGARRGGARSVMGWRIASRRTCLTCARRRSSCADRGILSARSAGRRRRPASCRRVASWSCTGLPTRPTSARQQLSPT